MSVRFSPSLVTGIWYSCQIPVNAFRFGKRLDVYGADTRLGAIAPTMGPHLRVTGVLRSVRVAPDSLFSWEVWALDAMDDSDRSHWHGVAAAPHSYATLHRQSTSDTNDTEETS
jgi:hypothetical protein